MSLAFGTSKYLRFDSPADLCGSPLSIAFWFYPDVTTPTMDNWVLRAGHTSSLHGIRVNTVIGQAAQLRFYAGYNTVTLRYDTVTGSYTSGQWNHVVVTWDGTQSASGVNFHVDGSGVSSSVEFDGNGSQYTTAWYWDIGYNTTGPGLEGKLAEMGVWSRVLEAGEIASISAGYSPLFFPRDLVFAPPLIRDAVDPVGGRTGSMSTTPPDPFDHPPIIRPTGPLAVGQAGSGTAAKKVPWHLFVGSAV